jgi:CubicO group peptidase (beta-lactamase class C family)
LFDEDNYVTAISLIVVRNKKLVAEAYVRNLNDRYQKRQIQSMTKCITSLVFGIARDMGYFSDLDQRLYDIVPDAFDVNARKRTITLRHLLTMNSGLDFNNEDFADELFMHGQRNVMSYILAKPLFAEPGQVYDYRDCDPQLLSGAVHRQTGMTLDQIAESRLFGRMGIADYYWERNPDGDSWAAEALFMRPRDLAKIGQLVLDSGRWNNQQLVAEEWIAQSTSTQSRPNRNQPSNAEITFGYYWRLQPNRTAIEANGAGGQQILIIPEKNLVIVFTCEPYVNGKYSLASANYIIAEAIVNSIIN